MNIVIINDNGNDENIREFIAAGVRLGKPIVYITPQDYRIAPIKKAALVIICNIKNFPYHQIGEIMFEITEQRCPYVNIEFSANKLEHAYIGWSYFARAIQNFFKNNNTLKIYLKYGVHGIMLKDAYSTWRAIDHRMKDCV